MFDSSDHALIMKCRDFQSIEITTASDHGGQGIRVKGWLRCFSSRSRRALCIIGTIVFVAFFSVGGYLLFQAPSNTGGGGHAEVAGDMSKSFYDKRSYRYMTLSNGLKVVCVSDPDTDMSAASMSVHVGSMSDPLLWPGLAHFLEHMLFMGNSLYPDENAYFAYLNENGGILAHMTSAVF
jgi:hypothetical protein